MRTFEAKNGGRLTALNDTQADAMLKGGMIEVKVSKAETKAATAEANKDKGSK